MNNSQFSSSVGNVVDVATPATRKLRLLGFVWVLVTLFVLVLINYIIFDTLTSDEPIMSLSHPAHLLGAALMPALGWFALGSALHRFHAAATKERYFRAGPGGISVSLPDDSLSATFRFSFKTISFDLPWEQIKTWYPFVQSMNGIPTERSIVFETLQVQKVKIKTFHFAEKQKEIAEGIRRARLLPLTVIAPAAASHSHRQDLPQGTGERSFEIKKKRDAIKEIDLSTIPREQRAAHIEKTADVLEEKLGSLCPSTAGYSYSRKHYRPFNEWKNVLGVRLFVQHGLLRGYELQVEPNDSDCRKLTISICPSSRLADLRRYTSIAVGTVFLVYSLQWWTEIRNSLNDFAQLTPLVLLVLAVAVGAISMALLQLPILLLNSLFSDKQNEEVQKQQIRLSVQEASRV